MATLATLLRSYELSSNFDYFNMIIRSVINGQRTQSQKLFKKLPKQQRKDFIKYITTVIPDSEKRIFSQSEIHWFIDNI
jgi:hypothetical protein